MDTEGLEMKSTVMMEREDQIDFVGLSRTLWSRRKFIAGVAGVGLALSVAVSLLQPNVYTASATLMPIDSSSDRLSAAFSSMGALGGLAMQAGGGLKGTTSDKFVALLESRRITEAVISKNNLLETLITDKKNRTMHEGYRVLSRMFRAKSDPKTGMVTLYVDYVDPKLAADIANDFVIELNAYLKGNSFSSAKVNRDFLEKQVSDVTQDLAAMENSLKKFQEDHKLVSLDAQTQAAVQAYANLKSELMAKEIELSLQEQSVSENDMGLITLEKEVNELKSKLGGLETQSSGAFVAFKDAPELGMRFAQLKRDLLVKQKVFELLTQQLELAKIEEAKESLSFQIVDTATPPDRKSAPSRTMNVFAGGIVSLFLGVLMALGLEKYALIRKSLEQSKEATGTSASIINH
jgi:Uncharacterized protein involved in exopolysaccharide biosynthesis